MRKMYPVVGLFIAMILTLSFSSVLGVSEYNESDSIVVGPYIDQVIFQAGFDPEDLLDGSTDLHTGYLDYYDSDEIELCESDPDISTTSALRNLLATATINCGKYPFNNSGLRRAIAFAMNKSGFVSNYLHGFGLAHDSVVPQANPWCAEDEFGWHYYEAQPSIGNSILDDLGFSINATSGYRLLPNGSAFEVVVFFTYMAPSSEWLPDQANRPGG